MEGEGSMAALGEASAPADPALLPPFMIHPSIKSSKVWSSFRTLIRNALINLVISSIFTVSIYFLCLLCFRPFALRPEVDSAVLVDFDLTPAPVGHSDDLLYDLALNITFTNKYSMSVVQFKHLTAGLYYSGAKISPTNTTFSGLFKLRKEGSRTLQYALRGRARNVSTAVAEAFARERARGLFNIDVSVRIKLTYRFFPHRVSYYKHYDCRLQFPPLPGDGAPAVTGAFECDAAK